MLGLALILTGCQRSDADRVTVSYHLATRQMLDGVYERAVFRPQHVDLYRRDGSRVEVMALVGSTTAAERYALLNRAIRMARSRGHAVTIERSP